MTLADIQTHFYFLTGKDATSFPVADQLISINKWYHRIATWIIESQDEWEWQDFNRSSGDAILTKSLSANTQNYDLAASDDIFQLKRVEVTYDGTNWYKAEPFDLGERGLATDTTSIAADFSKTAPFYALRANAIWLYPIPDATSTNGLKIWVNLEPTNFTSSDLSTGTKIPGFEEGFHEIIPYGVAFDWSVAHDELNKADIWEKEILKMESALKQHYGHRQEDRHISLKAAYTTYE